MASNNAMEPIAVNGGVTSLPILRETVNTVSEECPTRLGLTAEEIENKAPSLDVFFDTIAAAMPSREAVEEAIGGGLEGNNEEIFVFPGSCPSCSSSLDTLMKKVSIPYFKVSLFVPILQRPDSRVQSR